MQHSSVSSDNHVCIETSSATGSTSAESCSSPVKPTNSVAQKEEQNSVAQKEEQNSVAQKEEQNSVAQKVEQNSNSHINCSSVSTESEDVKILTHILTNSEHDPTYVSGASGTAQNCEKDAKSWHALSQSGLRYKMQMAIEKLILQRANKGTDTPVQTGGDASPSVSSPVPGSPHIQPTNPALFSPTDCSSPLPSESSTATNSPVVATNTPALFADSATNSPVVATNTPALFADSVAEISAIVDNQMYHEASSLQEYTDASTLPARILVLVKDILVHFKASGSHIDHVLDDASQTTTTTAAAVDSGRHSHTGAAVASSDNGGNSAAVHTGAAVASSDNGGNSAAVVSASASDLEFARVLSSLSSGSCSGNTNTGAVGWEGNVSTSDSASASALAVVSDSIEPSVAPPSSSTGSMSASPSARAHHVSASPPSAGGHVLTKKTRSVGKSSTTVSSQGCSRLFIVRVLHAVW